MRRRPALVEISAIFAILAAAILAMILVGLNIGSHPVSASPPTTSPPAASSPQTGASTGEDATSAQAARINNLLTASAATRNLLATALQDARHCNDIADAAAAIKAVAQRYGTEYGMAAHLETGQLPNGVALKNDLIDAYYRSAIADYYFAEWAQYLKVSGCTSSTSAAAAYNAGVENTAKATRAKGTFAKLWNPVAKIEGLATRSGDGI